LLDEADALFGNRTEVNDSNDRYANLDVSYLLQRLEGYEGIVVLTTHARENVDAAFLRRMRYCVDFPSPA
jgi:SpoVK/Ycf46/Vps4 family AAA+-type ATPase